MFELLESRRLLSGTPSVSVVLDGTILRITGTGVAESVFVTETKNTFQVAQQFGNDLFELAAVPERMVTRVVLDGDGGNDFLVLQTTGKIGGDVFGGSGDDEIHLEDNGSAVSTAHGGSNDDLLVIFKGNGSQVFGDTGNDRLISLEASKTTYLFGNNGTDNLLGTSMTIMDGGNGTNVITVAQ